MRRPRGSAVHRLSRVKKATLPVFKDLYKAVKTGAETKRVLRSTGEFDIDVQLHAEVTQTVKVTVVPL